MSDYEIRHRHRCPCGAEFEIEGSRAYTEAAMETLVEIHQRYCQTYQSVTAEAISYDLIRQAVGRLNEQNVPVPHIVYVNNCFYKLTLGHGVIQFSIDGVEWYDWSDDNPACRWWRDNIR